ncbi:protein kinase domain protein [Ichthyophthirius multifiliis]|uniref:Protein kinase domain protein n=1 Tax=Ichthyophthirius multifiliis TaxID=5932 RepID=G0QJW4_ICHMU|nr:protein kinase domain protein [Ichthyophthirius multifiliis]EGR34492.1 protein kinase domain protein [Ichthyophthirius multifiliis]|eukprot:XP_004039796.1 protein kinase domain protein [Ichthyophthirius multifiliis]
METHQQQKRDQQIHYKQIGQYQLIKEIGNGQFARVYYTRSVDPENTQEYAIKTFQINRLKPENQDQIDKEINILLKLNHPNIIKFYEYKKTQNNVYLIFEYCELGDLENYMKKYHDGRFPISFAQKVMNQISKAFKEVRRLKIVHRDLKLANILINKDLIVKLSDFGFAKHFEENILLQSYCGTPITMAPEILKRQQYNEKCDIWSLGVILYQMIFGKLPFQPPKGANIIDLINIIDKGKVQFDNLALIPQDVIELIEKMLDVNVQKRMSFQEFFEYPWINVKESVEEIKTKQNKALRFVQKYIFQSLREDITKFKKFLNETKVIIQNITNDQDNSFAKNCAWASLLILLLKTVKNMQNGLELVLFTNEETYEYIKAPFPKEIQDSLKEECKEIGKNIEKIECDNTELQKNSDAYNMLFICLLHYADFQLINEYLKGFDFLSKTRCIFKYI